MPSITTWLRLEPHSRHDDLETPLQLRVHDPLWLLGRQWQVGEFVAGDGGPPARLDWSAGQLAFRQLVPDLGAGAAARELVAAEPLDPVVEGEVEPAVARFDRDRVLSAQAGQRFAEMIDARFGDGRGRTVAAACRFTTPVSVGPGIDERALSFLRMVAELCIDAVRLVEGTRLVDAASLIALGFANPDDHPAASQVVADWRAWCEHVVGPLPGTEPVPGCWNLRRQTYAFAIATDSAADGTVRLAKAIDYRGGGLEWFDFDAGRRPGLPPAAAGLQAVAATVFPTDLSFHGRTGKRLWEFEDRDARMDGVNGAAVDLMRLPFLDTLLHYGNDFYRFTLDLDRGTLLQDESLVVRDSFGNESRLAPYRTDDWHLFDLTAPPPVAGDVRDDGLFLPALCAKRSASTPIERVSLLRDEMANMAWGVESVVTSVIGLPLDRHEADQLRRQRQQVDGPPPGQGALVYQLDTFSSVVPQNWIPLVASEAGPPLRLVCPSVAASQVWGRVIGETLEAMPTGIDDAAVARAGTRITRAWSSTRTTDGGMRTWVGRQAQAGRGEASSGLVYDTTRIDPPAAA